MKTNKWVEQVALWAVLYVAWVLFFQHHALTWSRTMTVEFCYLLFIAGNYYLHTLFSIPRLLNRNKYVWFALSLIGGLLAGALLRSFLARYMNRHYFAPNGPQPEFRTLFINSLTNISVWVIGLLALRMIADKIRLRKHLQALENDRTRHELDFLKAQINPHFLFNSINSIYGHIDKTNPMARNILLKFSEMLRYQLYECNVETISIDREIQYIRNYVALQQSRMEEDLVIDLTISERVTGCMIAPMLFIGFIENAFKYVSNHDQGGNRISIAMDKQDEMLSCSIYNTVEAGLRKSANRPGIGIANTKRRLALIYPDQYQLTITDQPDFFQVELNLQLS